MGDVRADMSADAACDVLWPLIRDQAGLPVDRGPRPTRGARRSTASWPRPGPAAAGAVHAARPPPRTPTTRTPAGGPSRASSSRCAASRSRATRASLHADPLKCKVLTSAALKPDLDALLEPLRRGDPEHWEVVTSMRVLGVTLSDPTDRAQLERCDPRDAASARRRHDGAAHRGAGGRRQARHRLLRADALRPPQRPLPHAGVGPALHDRMSGRRSTRRSRASARRCARLDQRGRLARRRPSARSSASRRSSAASASRASTLRRASAPQTSGTTATRPRPTCSPRTSRRPTTAPTHSMQAGGTRSAWTGTTQRWPTPLPTASPRRTRATSPGGASGTSSAQHSGPSTPCRGWRSSPSTTLSGTSCGASRSAACRRRCEPPRPPSRRLCVARAPHGVRGGGGDP